MTDETTQQEAGYSVTDLPDGAQPDPLGDARLSPRERVGATDEPEQTDDTADRG